MNKKAGISEGITWVVATIIVMVVLAIFIYAANAMGTFRTYSLSSGEIKVEVDSQLKIKTQIAFEKSEGIISSDEQIFIENWLKEPEKLKEEEDLMGGFIVHE